MATRDDDQRQVTNWENLISENKDAMLTRQVALAKRFRKGHEHWVEALGYRDSITEIFHYRVEDTRYERKTPAWTHVHVVVLNDGRAYVGVHRTQRDKQYVRKIGYTASLGKAMAKAVREVGEYDFVTHDLGEMRGGEQYEYIRDCLNVLNRLRP